MSAGTQSILKNTMLATHGQLFFEMAYNFKDGASFREFVNAVERNSRRSGDPLKFKGDCLEIFAEIFFNAFKNDPAVGVDGYSPVDITNDYGVDAVGWNADNRRIAVQVKYRSNKLDPVRYEEIAKTYTSGTIMLDLDLRHKQSIYVFTTANDVTPACSKVFGSRLVMIGFDGISGYVDNNVNFWDFAFNEVFNYLNV